MLSQQRIVFVGPGVMGEAIVVGLLARAGVPPDRIRMAGPRPERLEELAARHHVATTTDNRAAVADADIVVISVKPQSLGPVLAQLHGAIPAGAMVLSIVAGARLSDISGHLEHPAIARAMPNTPAQIGEGITVWTVTAGVSEVQKALAREVLASLGKEVFAEDEEYLDMATALSGTGPAYVFLFMEAMVDAGVHLGFPRRIAEELVVQTVRGSVAFYEHSPSHLARLRNQVTSPAGTTAAALYYLDKAGFRPAISRAIWAAYERSVQLGRGKKRAPVGND
ncbi:MAG: pyrroline-5-carboxylate reductase [Chloroflexi bacterium RBG_13_68_17]|jgi:pyrroline-5-carboxylate reductase|nr:MAG: pyrroline-5-carboxylate reductase [Chloroflexi bacterium RBG_13_68_17]